MDKQLLNALDNLSISLEEIVKALNNKNDRLNFPKPINDGMSVNGKNVGP